MNIINNIINWAGRARNTARPFNWAGTLSRIRNNVGLGKENQSKSPKGFVARLVVRPVFSSFFRHLWSPWAREVNRNRSKHWNRRKNREISKKSWKSDLPVFALGRPNDPKLVQKIGPELKKYVRRRRRKRFLSLFLADAVRSHSPDRFLEGLTLENCAPTTAGARFWQNHRFQKNTETVASGEPFWDQKSTKIDAGGAENHKKCPKNMFFEMPIFMCFFACEKNTKKHAKKLRSGRLGGMRGVSGEVRRGA